MSKKTCGKCLMVYRVGRPKGAHDTGGEKLRCPDCQLVFQTKVPTNDAPTIVWVSEEDYATHLKMRGCG